MVDKNIPYAGNDKNEPALISFNRLLSFSCAQFAQREKLNKYIDVAITKTAGVLSSCPLAHHTFSLFLSFTYTYIALYVVHRKRLKYIF